MAEWISDLMWPPPIFVSFCVVWFLNVFLLCWVIILSRALKRARETILWLMWFYEPEPPL